MISWMQKHNKYLVWTIWVATITFIGAGFVGWGTLSFNSKNNAIADVGDVTVTQAKFNMIYSSLYNRYNTMLQGKLDEAKAKELGLPKQALARAEVHARLLNYAKEIGLLVSDREVADKLNSMPMFQRNGSFDKSIYETYLKRNGLSVKTYEELVREDMLVSKLLSLIELDPLPFEHETVRGAFSVADKLAYRIVTKDDVRTPTINEEEIKRYWEAHKNDYLTPPRYKVALVWIDTANVDVKESELQTHYRNNNYNYIDANGSILPFEQAKAQLIRDVRLKKGKKEAQLAYIKFKKEERQADETLVLDEHNATLPDSVWEQLAQAQPGSILKPKAIDHRYVVVKLIETVAPHPMAYEEAKASVKEVLQTQQEEKIIEELSQKALQSLDNNTSTQSDFITIDTQTPLDGLNLQEMTLFLQKLFTTQQEKGIIKVSKSKRVAYRILEQKLGKEDNATHPMTASLKQRVFETNLLEALSKRYPTKVYVKGL